MKLKSELVENLAMKLNYKFIFYSHCPLVLSGIYRSLFGDYQTLVALVCSFTIQCCPIFLVTIFRSYLLRVLSRSGEE